VLAAAIAAHELAWYGYTVVNGSFRPPHGLPLDLCDVVLWLTVYALATLRPWALDLVYYFGLAGSGMAILTPDVGAPFPSYPAITFFAAHGGVVASILFLVLARMLPRPNLVARARVAQRVCRGGVRVRCCLRRDPACAKPAASLSTGSAVPGTSSARRLPRTAVLLYLPFRHGQQHVPRA
jgi:hypothetical protein